MSGKWLGNLVGVGCMLCWATNFSAADLLLQSWHPMLLAAMRLLVAGTFLTLLAIAAGQGRYLLALPVSTMIGAVGVGLGISTILFVWGQKLIDPVSAAIIVSSLPLVSVIFGMVQGTERLTPVLALAITLAMAGGVLASLGSSGGAASGRPGSILGILLILSGVIFYVWYSRGLVSKHADIPDLAKAAAGMIVAALVVIISCEVALIFGLIDVSYSLDSWNVGLLLWLGCVAVGGSTALWLMAGRMIGVTVAAMHHNMVPFYVMIIALAFGGTVSGQTIAGAGLVLAGAVIAQWPQGGMKLRRRRL